MHRNLATALAVLSLPISAGMALADPAPEGTAKTLNFSVAVKEQSKGEWASSAIARVLNAQCVLIAGPAVQISWDGPTAAQEAATAQAQANGQAFEQNYAPSEATVANMEAMVEKCGEDEACLMAAVQQMSQTQEIQDMAAKQGQAAADVAGLMPDLGPARYQTWSAQNCSGTLSVDDTYVDSDPGGEGGVGAYTDTTTVKGSAPVDPQAIVFEAETDSLANTTRYRLATTAMGSFPATSSLKGAGQRQVQLMGSTALPQVIGPMPGNFGADKKTVSGDIGTVTLSLQGQ
ncbi:MAG: hypothetical protein IPK59_21045 [Rhodospirillaceae bacterium]|nr:hypothetical protein [Rhodospirillaceae bacterium]